MLLTIKKSKIKALWRYFCDLSALNNNLQFCGRQIVGSRTTQQDSFDIVGQITLPEDKKGTLLLLADGMGGHQGGSEASQMVVDTFHHIFTTKIASARELFEQSLDLSLRKIVDYIATHPQYEGMGTTVVAALVVEKGLYWLSVGDSPLWLLRNGQIYRLNEDHSMLPVLLKMADMGEIEKNDVYQDPNRHVLRSVVNGKPVKLTDVNFSPMALGPGDTIILASDGLQTLSESTILALSGKPYFYSCKSKVTALLNNVKEENKTDQDNTTVIVAALTNPMWLYIKIGILGFALTLVFSFFFSLFFSAGSK